MGKKWLFRHQDLQIAKISNLVPLEVVVEKLTWGVKHEKYWFSLL